MFVSMHRVLSVWSVLSVPVALGGEGIAPFPRVQAIPQPGDQVSFQRDGVELVRYHFERSLRRPFWFPLVGPGGHVVTRLGQPDDPMGHSHHNSVWVSHNDVNGVNFWADTGEGRIVHQAVERFDDGAESAALTVRNAWVHRSGKVLLNERRRTTIRLLPDGEWFLIVELHIEPVDGDVAFGQTPFGLFAVRVAKTMSVRDGGGTIRNSAGGVNEKGVLWKPAQWVDYSGPAAPGRLHGITLMDHPGNPNHPSVFHVRDNGWMGSSFSFHAPYVLRAGQRLRLMYGLYVHDGMPVPERIDRRFAEFARTGHTETPASTRSASAPTR